VKTCLPLEVKCQTVLYTVVIFLTLVTYFPLITCFPETNTFYCVTLLTFQFKIVNVQRCPLLILRCPCVGQLWSKYRGDYNGFVFKVSRRGEFSYCLTVKINIIVCVDFLLQSSIHFNSFTVQYKDFKRMFKSAPLSLVY